MCLPNSEIIFKLQLEYTQKPLPIAKKVNSLVTLILDQSSKFRYHEDMWNEKDCSHEDVGMTVKELNSDQLTKITQLPEYLLETPITHMSQDDVLYRCIESMVNISAYPSS